MRIGIDVGGTHSDGVLLDGSTIVAAAKTSTDHQNLLASIIKLLQVLLTGQDVARIRTINLSTTLTTNAIVTNKLSPVAVLVTAGPGIDPENYRIGTRFDIIPGSLNHVGSETNSLDEDYLAKVVDDCYTAGIRHFALISKFSPRNPTHEEQMRQVVSQHDVAISCGHMLSGRLNFGRRINTTYFNAAVQTLAQNFADTLANSLAHFGLNQAEVNILKADGGTLPLKRALELPVQSIFSGPAASVMGILASTELAGDILMLDIGGTTTDIALFAAGQPLLEREGIDIGGHATLVRALRVHSIGIGGDSLLHVDALGVHCGPQRIGPCMAAEGPAPTLMDALNILGKAAFGEVERSFAGMGTLASEHGLIAVELAEAALADAVRTMKRAAETLIEEVNSKPVYTIHEILTEQAIKPEKLVLIGGPAPVFQQILAEAMGMESICPPLASVSNAIGAALSRSTGSLHIQVDTSRGRLTAPTLNLVQKVPRSCSLDTSIENAKSLLLEDLNAAGIHYNEEDMQVIQADSFNMVEQGYTMGKNMRVSVQIRPAVLAQVAMAKDAQVVFAA